MINTMPIKYCYKAIHSFYYNFYNINEYDKIKKIILNSIAPNDSFDVEVKTFHNAALLLFNNRYLCYENFVDVYKYINGATDEDFLKYASTFFKDDIFSKCAFLYEDIKMMNRTNAYFAYLIALRKLSEHFEDYFFIPITFVEKTSDIDNSTVRRFFIKGWFHNLAELNETPPDNLLTNIQNCYIDKIETFPQIKHLFLFGSIPSGMYHRESDVDMVVEFKGTPPYYTVQDTFKEIKSLNKQLFHLDTDIYEISQFIESNPELKLTQIF